MLTLSYILSRTSPFGIVGLACLSLCIIKSFSPLILLMSNLLFPIFRLVGPACFLSLRLFVYIFLIKFLGYSYTQDSFQFAVHLNIFLFNLFSSIQKLSYDKFLPFLLDSLILNLHVSLNFAVNHITFDGN